MPPRAGQQKPPRLPAAYYFAAGRPRYRARLSSLIEPCRARPGAGPLRFSTAAPAASARWNRLTANHLPPDFLVELAQRRMAWPVKLRWPWPEYPLLHQP